MSRAVLAWDRVVTVVVGLALLALGVLAVVWWGAWWTALPRQIDVSRLLDLRQQQWFPWVVAVVGILLFVLGLRWLAAHLPNRGVSVLQLPDDERSSGRLTVEAGAVADGLGDALETAPDVRSARAAVRRDRGQLVMSVRATVGPDADLRRLGRDVEAAFDALDGMIRRDDLTRRLEVRVSR